MLSLERIIYVEAKARKHKGQRPQGHPTPLPHSTLHVIGPKEQIEHSIPAFNTHLALLFS